MYRMAFVKTGRLFNTKIKRRGLIAKHDIPKGEEIVLTMEHDFLKNWKCLPQEDESSTVIRPEDIQVEIDRLHEVSVEHALRN